MAIDWTSISTGFTGFTGTLEYKVDDDGTVSWRGIATLTDNTVYASWFTIPSVTMPLQEDGGPSFVYWDAGGAGVLVDATKMFLGVDGGLSIGATIDLDSLTYQGYVPSSAGGTPLGWLLIDSNGNIYDLNDQASHFVMPGVEGRFMPPIEFLQDVIPQQPGSRMRSVRTAVREVAIPILVKKGAYATLRNQLRALASHINPHRTGLILRCFNNNGTSRDLNCYYASGMQLNESESNAGPGWQKAVLVLSAFDPYWYTTDPVEVTYTIGTEDSTFFPFFPLTLTASSVFTDTIVNNDGDIEAWPVWIINGPAENVSLENLDTGELLVIEYELEVGESITIDTRPFEKTVTKNDGTNLFPQMTNDSAMWSFPPGDTNMRVELNGATEDSSVDLSYYLRHLTV